MLRKLALILVLEIAIGFNAGVSFQMFPRYYAGLWAGGWFVLIGLFILAYFFRWNFKSKSPLFWAAMVHTFGFAIPMVAQRIVVSPDVPVAEVFTIPMAYFHKASMWVYGIMFGATLFEMALEIARMRKKNPKI